MVTFIRLYPIFAICVFLITVDLARNLRRKGKHWWSFALLGIIMLGTMALWWMYRGDKNAERWAKEWASLTLPAYTQSV